MTRRLALILLVVLAAGAGAGAATANGVSQSFVDPTVTIYGAADIHLGDEVFVGPFARLLAAGATRAIHVGDESNIQDSVIVDATRGRVTLGEMAILAHGSTAKSGAEIGERGTCPGAAAHCPSFVGFNSEVDGAVLDKDAMVLHLARVGPGVHVPSGRKVLSGKNVVRQDQVMAKTEPVTEADRAFMAGVVEVNVAFAHGYAQLQARTPATCGASTTTREAPPSTRSATCRRWVGCPRANRPRVAASSATYASPIACPPAGPP